MTITWLGSAGVYWDHWEVTLSGDFSGTGGQRYYFGQGRVGVLIRPYRRHRLSPTISFSGERSEVSLFVGELKKESKGWGVNIEVGIDSPFESLTYSYSTNLGGYHEVKAFFAVGQLGSSRLGTVYVFRSQSSVRSISIAIVIEGMKANNHMGPVGFLRDMERPLLHKILAFGGAAPVMIAVGAVKLFNSIF